MGNVEFFLTEANDPAFRKMLHEQARIAATYAGQGMPPSAQDQDALVALAFLDKGAEPTMKNIAALGRRWEFFLLNKIAQRAFANTRRLAQAV